MVYECVSVNAAYPWHCIAAAAPATKGTYRALALPLLCIPDAGTETLAWSEKEKIKATVR